MVSAFSLQNVLTCFVLIDLNLVDCINPGDACLRLHTLPCNNELGNYVEVLHTCLTINTQKRLNWEEAKAYCNRYGGHLVEPHSPEGSREIHEFAKKKNTTESWIGLAYDKAHETFLWSSDGRPLEEDHIEIVEGLRKGQCVHSLLRGVVIWEEQACDVVAPFICEFNSEFMPGRPRLFVDQDLTRTTFEVGSPLAVRCRSLLSVKGELRIAIFSGDHIQFINEVNYPGAKYSENKSYTLRWRCKRHGSLSLTLFATPDMNDKTLACVSFIDQVLKMCSPYDPYCDVAGTLHVNVPTGSLWWHLFIIIPAVAVTIGSVLLARKQYVRGSGAGQDRTSSIGSGVDNPPPL